MDDLKPFLLVIAAAAIVLVIWYHIAPAPRADPPGTGDAYSVGPGY